METNSKGESLTAYQDRVKELIGHIVGSEQLSDLPTSEVTPLWEEEAHPCNVLIDLEANDDWETYVGFPLDDCDIEYLGSTDPLECLERMSEELDYWDMPF